LLSITYNLFILLPHCTPDKDKLGFNWKVYRLDMKNITKDKNKRNNKGFTLGEIITTVAIIGTITSMALPQYLKLRMNTNEAMVKQQMRIVGEKMAEIMGKEGQFPDSEEWPNLVGNEDEISLTASLSAIDSLCYTNYKSDYIVNEGRSTFEFCTRPKSDSCGKYAGSKKFCIHANPSNVAFASVSPFTVGQFEFWEGTFSYDPSWVSGLNTDATFESNPSRLSGWLREAAYFIDVYHFAYARDMFEMGLMTEWSSNDGLVIPVKNLDQFKATLSQISANLLSQGIEVVIGKVRGTIDADGNSDWVQSSNGQLLPYGEDYANGQVVEIGFKFTDQSQRVASAAAYDQKMAEFCNDPNSIIFGQAYIC
jgi:prepilin-type N-terminal cleavage/methylation domain-containing protein